MAVLNQSNFMVCENCGFAEINNVANVLKRTTEKVHVTSNGSKCSNKMLRRFSLGYRFQTDVIQIKFCWPELREYYQALSVLYALMKGACNVLNIEQSDIAGTIQYFKNEDTNHGCYKIIIYDDTPGGAGHVKRLYDVDMFKRVLNEAYRIVDKCNCGGDIKDTSCYSYLRTYSNQRFHNVIQRRYVLDFLDKVFDDSLAPYVCEEDEGEENSDALSRGKWDEINDLLQYSDDDVKGFALQVEKSGVESPDCVGYEIMDNNKVIAEAELAWIDKKIVYLSSDQMKNAEKLVNKGWTVFDIDHPFIKEVFL